METSTYEPLLTRDNTGQESIEFYANSFVKDLAKDYNFDFSVESLRELDKYIEERTEFFLESPELLEEAKCLIGCYILEVSRRNFGGEYKWWELHTGPILVTGFPENAIGLFTFDKVENRIKNGADDNIPFFFDGFRSYALRAKMETGLSVTYV